MLDRELVLEEHQYAGKFINGDASEPTLISAFIKIFLVVERTFLVFSEHIVDPEYFSGGPKERWIESVKRPFQRFCFMLAFTPCIGAQGVKASMGRRATQGSWHFCLEVVYDK